MGGKVIRALIKSEMILVRDQYRRKYNMKNYIQVKQHYIDESKKGLTK